MKNLISPLLIIFFAVVLRVVPHPANIAPITAMALFGGAYLDKKYAIVVPLLAMLVSDFFIGFHDTMPFVYVSFILVGLIGIWLKERRTIAAVIIATFVSSLLFFIITNFGVWLVSPMYAKTGAGLVESYTLAVPFFRNTIVGDFFFATLFFGSFELIKQGLNIKAIE
jgi:hypothetical protein